MPLNHHFVLLPETGARRRQYQDLCDPRRSTSDRRQLPTGTLALSDDLFGYLSDSFAWIPSEHPAQPGVPVRGLDRFHVTAISGDGARLLASVLRAWAAVFENGPATIKLTGDWERTVGEDTSGRYEELIVTRDPLLATLKAIAALADEAGRAEHWLLHLGI